MLIVFSASKTLLMGLIFASIFEKILSSMESKTHQLAHLYVVTTFMAACIVKIVVKM